MTKTEKNHLLIYISTDNITELNELIYAGAKLVGEKFGILSKSTKKKIQTRMGNSSGNADKKSTKAGQNNKKRKTLEHVETKKKATQRKITIQLAEIHHKVLTKEGGLKRYQQRFKNTVKTGHSKTTKGNSTNN